MKSLIVALTLVSSSVMAANVTFNYKTQNLESSAKDFIVKTLKTKCSNVFSDEETSVVVTNVEVDRIDQGMELEYVATVAVIEDYGHSPAKTITIEFDEEQYHSEGYSLFDIKTSHAYLCN